MLKQPSKVFISFITPWVARFWRAWVRGWQRSLLQKSLAGRWGTGNGRSNIVMHGFFGEGGPYFLIASLGVTMLISFS